jgi:hypothetical protein
VGRFRTENIIMYGNMDCDYLLILRACCSNKDGDPLVLIGYYTSVPSWQACRDRHIVLASILGRALLLGVFIVGRFS